MAEPKLNFGGVDADKVVSQPKPEAAKPNLEQKKEILIDLKNHDIKTRTSQGREDARRFFFPGKSRG